jgi:hypothetical protein
MRIEIVRRIGEAAVVELENTAVPERGFTREELIEIKGEYQEKFNRLRAITARGTT